MNFQDHLIQIILEAHAAHRDPKSKRALARGDADAGYAGPLARSFGTERMSKTKPIKDFDLHANVSLAVKNLNRKLRVKTDPKLHHMVQSALLRNRNKGPKGFSPLSKQHDKADVARDKWRRQSGP